MLMYLVQLISLEGLLFSDMGKQGRVVGVTGRTSGKGSCTWDALYEREFLKRWKADEWI